MSDLYVLVGQTPVKCADLLEWARWFEENSEARRVGLTEVGPYTVSTVFLGLDHSHARFMPGRENAPPILFETMAWITGSDADAVGKYVKFPHGFREFLELQERCSTWLQAEAQHRAVVKQLREPGDDARDLLAAPEISA